MMPSNASN
jgi:hypothetical protein